MPALVAAGIAAATGLAATSTAVVIGSNILVAGVSLGASYALQSALAPKSTGATLGQAVNSSEVRASIRQSTPARRVVYGAARVGGAVFFLEVVPPNLYLGLMHSARRISAVKQAWIGEKTVAFGPDLAAITDPFYTGSASMVSMSFRVGDAAQAIDPILSVDFANLDVEFRQRGIATSVWKFNYGSSYDNFLELYGNVQIPNVQLLLDGAQIYDPRDSAQSRDDETTWKFSSNATLIQVDFLRQTYGGGIDAARIDWEMIAAAADYDDNLVAIKSGGWLKRYTVDGLVILDQNPYEILQSLLTANRGLVVQNGDRVGLVSAKPTPATFTVHDGNIAGGFSFRDSRPKKDVLNTVRSRFVAPEREYQTADGPVLVRADLQTTDGEPLETTIDLPFTRRHERAQRIMKAALGESRVGKQLTVPVKMDHRSIRIEAGDVVTVDSILLTSISGTYQVRERGYSEDFSTVALTLAEYDPVIETDWDAGADEQDFTLTEIDLS